MLNFTLRCHVSEKNPSFIYNKARNMPSSEKSKIDRYDHLLRHNSRSINLFCYLEARNPEDGRDLRQEVLTALWEGLENLKSDAGSWQEAAWVRRVMIRIGIDRDRHRKSQRHVGYTLPLEQVSELCQEEDARTEVVKEMLAYLDPRERQLVEENLAGYSAAELARMHGVSADGIRQRMYRIRKKMRTIYNKLYGRESE